MNQHVNFLRDRAIDTLLERQALVEEALAEGYGTHDFYDIVAGVLDQTYQFWPTARSIMITTVIIYPRKTVVQVFLAAGDLNEIKGLFDKIVAWGASLGVNTFLLTGRMGWVKALKEYGARVQATMILEV